MQLLIDLPKKLILTQKSFPIKQSMIQKTNSELYQLQKINIMTKTHSKNKKFIIKRQNLKEKECNFDGLNSNILNKLINHKQKQQGVTNQNLSQIFQQKSSKNQNKINLSRNIRKKYSRNLLSEKKKYSLIQKNIHISTSNRKRAISNVEEYNHFFKANFNRIKSNQEGSNNSYIPRKNQVPEEQIYQQMNQLTKVFSKQFAQMKSLRQDIQNKLRCKIIKQFPEMRRYYSQNAFDESDNDKIDNNIVKSRYFYSKSKHKCLETGYFKIDKEFQGCHNENQKITFMNYLRRDLKIKKIMSKAAYLKGREMIKNKDHILQTEKQGSPQFKMMKRHLQDAIQKCIRNNIQ